MNWFRSPHRNGKWHLISHIAVADKTRVFVARCGTMIGEGSAGSIPMREVAPPETDTCSKCLRKGRS